MYFSTVVAAGVFAMGVLAAPLPQRWGIETPFGSFEASPYGFRESSPLGSFGANPNGVYLDFNGNRGGGRPGDRDWDRGRGGNDYRGGGRPWRRGRESEGEDGDIEENVNAVQTETTPEATEAPKTTE